MSSSPYKRSASGQIKERKDDPAKRHKPGSSSPPDDPPSLSSSMQPNNSQAADMRLLENYINKAIQTIKTSLKPFLKHDYPVRVLRKLDIKIRKRIHAAICDKVIDSDAQVYRLYTALYNIPSDLELFKSVSHEYDETQKRLAMIDKINKLTKLTDMKPLSYSVHMAISLSNESIFTKVNSLADEVMTQAAQRQIVTELYEANNNIQHLPKNCIDEFTEIIRSTLNSLDKRDSEWHWSKIYELYRKDCSMKSDERQLLEICKAHGFKIPTNTRSCEHLYLDMKPPKPIVSATNIILNDLKMAVKTTCVDVNSSTSSLFKHYIGGIIKTIVGDEYFKIKPSSRTNVLVVTYHQYRNVDDDIELFQKFENEVTERTRRDTSSKELVSELHFWQNDNLTSNCFFDMVKITLSKIIGYILQYQVASLYHINFLIYEIRSELMKLTYKRNENKWALTYSEILLEFQNYSESKLNFYMERFIFIKTNVPDNETVEEKESANSYCSEYYNQKHEGLRQVVCKILKEKLDSIFDKGIKIHKGELKIENENDVKISKEPATVNNTQSGASEHENNAIYGSVKVENERHANVQRVEETSQMESILNTNVNELTQFKNIKIEQTAIDRNYDPNQSKTETLVEGIPIESALTKQIISTENSSTACPGGTKTSRIGLIKSEPVYEDKQTKDANAPGILNYSISFNIKCKALRTLQEENMTETEKQDNIVTKIESAPTVEDDEIENDIFLPMQVMTSNIKNKQITQDKDETEIVRKENVECGINNDTLLPISSAREVNQPEILNQEIALNIMRKPTNQCENITETEKQDNIVTNIKSAPTVEDDEIENDIFLPMQVMTSNIKNEQITQDKDETEIFRKENVECGINNDTLLPISSAREVNQPEILNQEIALNIMCKPTNQCENITETEKQDNIVTNIKSEPTVEDDKMENGTPMNSQTVNQPMGFNINHEHGERNTSGEHLSSTHTMTTHIKTEIINPDDNVIQDSSIEMNGINAHSTMDTIFTEVERELEPEGTRKTFKEEGTSTDDVKNVGVGNVDAATSINRTLSPDTNVMLAEEGTLRSTSRLTCKLPLVTAIHNMVDEYLFSVIPDLKKKLMSTMLNDNMLVNSFDKQLPKTDSQLIRLTGEPRLPALVTLLQFLKQFNPESIKMRKHYNNAIYVQTTDWSQMLDIGEVNIGGNKLLIEKENYCKKLVDITLDPDAIYLIKSLDQWNTEFVDQASQTFSDPVDMKSEPTNSEGPVKNDSSTIKEESINVSRSSRTPVAVTEPNNNVTRKSKRSSRNRKKKNRKNSYIDEEIEELRSYRTEDNESTHTGDGLDKILNDLDPELECLLTTIKETEKQSNKRETNASESALQQLMDY